ncbi:hypothetical protein [Mesorhizobium argentiipisi]|uniref:hypothetical protein n=1 Tax=Mesorhizobium argentiipisi TaxID=3015175 RepID=UPI0039F5F5B0
MRRILHSKAGLFWRKAVRTPLMMLRATARWSPSLSCRPIETILSGPAGSLLRYPTNVDDAVISDIRNMTTNIAVLEGGRLRLAPEGGTVGGRRAMAEAVARRTFGLGRLGSFASGRVTDFGDRARAATARAAGAGRVVHGDAVRPWTMG